MDTRLDGSGSALIVSGLPRAIKAKGTRTHLR